MRIFNQTVLVLTLSAKQRNISQ